MNLILSESLKKHKKQQFNLILILILIFIPINIYLLKMYLWIYIWKCIICLVYKKNYLTMDNSNINKGQGKTTSFYTPTKDTATV